MKYSEIFYSIQGEGRFIGVPSVFLRLFGCNLTCSKFGTTPGKGPTQEDYLDSLGHISELSKAPVPVVGCDSSLSWSSKFKHLAKEGNPLYMMKRVKEFLPDCQWEQPNGNDIHLVLTGGEPFLHQKELAEMLMYSGMAPLRNITFETNGTRCVNLGMERALFTKYLHTTWSVSPKLSNSGEDFQDAIRPGALKSMNDVKGSFLYLKFVVKSLEHFEEAKKAINYYKSEGVKIDAVYMMPEGAVAEQKDEIEGMVVKECLRQGFYYSPRLHIDLFGNKWGT